MTLALTADTTSDLVGRIYDCALDPELWPDTLAALKQALDFAHATLSLQAMPSGAVLFNVTSGISSPWRERIQHYGADIIALWGGRSAIAAAPMEEPVILSEMNAEVADGSSTNRYYLEWRRPQALIDTIAIGLIRDSTSLAAASLVRHADQGPIGERERQAVRVFAPHLRRAVMISRLLDAERVMAATFAATVDAMSVPVLLVGPALDVVHANAAARAMLDRGSVASGRENVLRLVDPIAEAALRAAVTQAHADEAAIGRKGLGIPVRDTDGALCLVHVLPLSRRTLRGSMAPSAVAAVFIASAGHARGKVGALLAPLLNLTHAEVRIFDLMADGYSVQRCAAQLGISVRTVRTHLERLFDKTGVSRQAELVRMAITLSLPQQDAD